MIYYLDASALVKVYSYEKGTEAIINLLKSKLPFYSSIIVYPEVLFTLRRKMENREMDQEEFSVQTERFNSHFLSLINCVQLNENTLDILENRVLQYSMRALDAIHLASALWIRENIDKNCGFICSDKNLLDFAEKESFDLINPEKEH
jgi:uncharacterized protein